MRTCLQDKHHSLLQIAHKHWKKISIVSLLVISTLGYTPITHASHVHSIHINYTSTRNNTRQTFSRNANQKSRPISNKKYKKSNKKSNKSSKLNSRNSSYITPDKSHNEYYFTNQDLSYFKRNSFTNYTNHLEKRYIPHRIFTKIYGRTAIANYHFDLVQFSKNHRGWVINTDLSHYRNYIHNDTKISNFFKKLYKQYLYRYYTNNQVNQILTNQAQFNELYNNENTTKDDSNLAHLRNEEIDWLNFYRQNLYHETGVKENQLYDKIAQESAKKDKDPEDMDWGSYAPHDSVFDYLTDANDVDNDGTTGHRYSILRPNSNQVGIGQYSDRNTAFFDWGLKNKTNINKRINYPTANIFPTEYAQDGEYWSYQIMSHKIFNHAKVHVRDRTLNDKLVKVSKPHIKNNVIYYKVNKDAIKNHHLYKIEVFLPRHKIVYNVRLYNLVQNY